VTGHDEVAAGSALAPDELAPNPPDPRQDRTTAAAIKPNINLRQRNEPGLEN
jgi:hypothetical protein